MSKKSAEEIFPQDLILEAKRRCRQKDKQMLDKFMSQHYAKETHFLLNNLANIPGPPVSAFLLRMIPGQLVSRFTEATIELALATRLSRLVCAKEMSHTEQCAVRTDALLFIRNALQDPAHSKEAREMIAKNISKLNHAFVVCLTSNDKEVTEEVCFTLCVVARNFNFEMTVGLDEVVSMLVRIMALSTAPWESVVELYRVEKERHADLEIARGQTLVFHYPDIELGYTEVFHHTMSVICYTLADLFHSCPLPRLIHFFECRIFRRKEMTRTALFGVFLVVVSFLTELQERANQLRQAMVGTASEANLARWTRLTGPEVWHDLPAYLYSDIIRVYNDRNRINKLMIIEIMSVLRNAAPEKLPLFEEAMLKVMDLYGGNGRFAETYQIGGGRAQVKAAPGRSQSDNAPGDDIKKMGTEKAVKPKQVPATEKPEPPPPEPGVPNALTMLGMFATNPIVISGNIGGEKAGAATTVVEQADTEGTTSTSSNLSSKTPPTIRGNLGLVRQSVVPGKLTELIDSIKKKKQKKKKKHHHTT